MSHLYKKLIGAELSSLELKLNRSIWVSNLYKKNLDCMILIIKPKQVGKKKRTQKGQKGKLDRRPLWSNAICPFKEKLILANTVSLGLFEIPCCKGDINSFLCLLDYVEFSFAKQH